MEKASADAEAEGNRLMVSAARKGPQYWPAVATRNERRWPERWGKRQEDGQAPRVVVQLGIQAGSVHVDLPDVVVEPRHNLPTVVSD